VRRIPDYAFLFAHDLETIYVYTQVFSDALSVCEDIVSSEEGVFFFQYEAYVIDCMALSKKSTKNGSSVFNTYLSSMGS